MQNMNRRIKQVEVKTGYTWEKITYINSGTRHYLQLHDEIFPAWFIEHQAGNRFTVNYPDYTEDDLKGLTNLKIKMIEQHKKFLKNGKTKPANI
jgi:hypothetical protein